MELSKKIALFIKTIIVLFSIGFIVFKLYNESLITNVFETFKHINNTQLLLLIPVVLMTFINWGIETFKWRFIIKKLQHLSIKRSVRAVLAGITVAIFTPNRVGEFGGRILALERKNRVAGVFATLLGGYAQLLITLIIGLISLPIYLHLHPSQFEVVSNINALFYICLVVILIALFVYLKIKFFARLFERLIKNNKKKRFVSFLKEYTTTDLLKILFFSLIRYFVFSTQFFLLLILFGIEITYIQGIISVGLVYFIMTIIPVISLFEFGVRGSVAILVLGVYSSSTLGILSATLLLWVFNLAVPALIGSIALYKFKL